MTNHLDINTSLKSFTETVGFFLIWRMVFCMYLLWYWKRHLDRKLRNCSEIIIELHKESKWTWKGCLFFDCQFNLCCWRPKSIPVQLIFGPYELYWSSFPRCQVYTFHVLWWDYTCCTPWKMSQWKAKSHPPSVLFLIPPTDLDFKIFLPRVLL